MNTKNDSFFIAFISLLILNMLLIFVGVFSYFFNVKDYTLMAGIISFFGAIIGGFITWLGVRYTILNQSRKEEKEKTIAKKRLIRLLDYTYKMVDSIPSLTSNFEMSVIVYDPKWGEYLGEMDFIDDSDVRTIVAWLTKMTMLEQISKSGDGTVKGYVVKAHTDYIKDKILVIINKYK